MSYPSLIAKPGHAPRIAAVSMVKNECDIIELFVRINARWADHFFIVDDGSVDSTLTILENLAQEGYPISVQPNQHGSDQSKVTTSLARQVASLGQYDFILPVDADEFVNDADLFFKELQSIPEGQVGSLKWATMVPRTASYFSFDAPLHHNFWRRKHELRQYCKIVLPGGIAGKCTMAVGNHTVSIDSEVVQAFQLKTELAHVPVRSKEQIMLKALSGSHKKSIKQNRVEGESFHFDLMANMIRARDFKLSDSDFIELAFDYSQLPEDGKSRETLDYRLGTPEDRIVYKELAKINEHRILDSLLFSFCQNIRLQHAKIEELRTQIARLNHAMEDRDRRIQQFMSSRSWRLTAPLRKLASIAGPR